MLSWAAVCAAALTVAATFVRLYIGADFLEESYYVALGYRSALGDRPFIDELNLTQSFALITGPLIRFFQFTTGGVEGLVLYTRRLFLVLNCVAAASVFFALRKRIEWPAALVICTMCVAFIPFNIPNLSYNTLGSALFTTGMFLAMRGVFDREAPSAFAAAGLAHGLAIVAYPSMIAPVTFFGGILLALVPDQRARRVGSYCAAGIAIGLLAFGAVGSEGVARAYEFMRQKRGGETMPLFFTLQSIALLGPSKLLLVAVLGLAGAAARQRPAWLAATIPLLPLLFAWEFRSTAPWSAGLVFVASWALLAPLLLPFVWRVEYTRHLMFGVWVPSLLAGIVVALTSNNGFLNAGLGLAPGALVTSVLLYETVRGASARVATPAAGAADLLGPLLVTAVLVSCMRGMYLTGGITEPRSRVDWGPFQGIYSTATKDDFLRGLWRDIEPLVNSNGRLLFYDHFPVGYLLAPMKLATPTIYTCFGRRREQDENLCSDFYLEHLHNENVVVEIPPSRSGGDLRGYAPARDVRLAQIVQQQHRMVVARRDARGRLMYRVYSGGVSP